MKQLNDFSYNELFDLAINKPVMAQIELTKNCNQQCFFCFRYCTPKKKYKDLSINSWTRAINKLIEIGIEELNFSGGEIFLYKEVKELFNYAKRHGIKKIVVNTNGQTDITKEDLRDVDELVFSIHALGNKHNQITGRKGAFKEVLKSLNDALKMKRLKVGINTVVSQVNIDELQKIYDYFKDKRLFFHAFNIQIDQNNPTLKMNIKKIFPEYLTFIKKIPENRRKLRHGMQNIFFKKFPESIVPLPNCAGGKYKLIVDYKGDVYPCRYFQNKEYYCGNILKGDIQNIWKKGKGFKKFRDVVIRRQYPSKCKSCVKKDKCVGGCLAWRLCGQKTKSRQGDLRCEFGDAYSRT